MSNYSEKSEGYNPNRSNRKHSPRNLRGRSPVHRRHSRTPPPSFRHIQTSRVASSRYRSRSRSPVYSSRYPIHKHLPRYDEPIRYIAPENNVLAIFGLSNRVIEHDLFSIYKHYGCKECKVIIDKNTGFPKGYGFVYFSRVKDAILAREKTDGEFIFGKPMRVDYSIGERDFTAMAAQQRHTIREPKALPINSHYTEPNHRDQRMQRGSIYLINDRYSSDKHVSNSRYYHEVTEHRHRNERRRVATPPIPHSASSHIVSDNFNKRSRSRTPHEKNKRNCKDYSRHHDLSHELPTHRR